MFINLFKGNAHLEWCDYLGRSESFQDVLQQEAKWVPWVVGQTGMAELH